MGDQLHSAFDHFADWIGEWTASAYFFTLCAVGVTGWLIGLPFAGPLNDTYHLLLNSPTTAITFLLVAVAANEQHRFEKATNKRLERIIEAVCGEDVVDDPGQKEDSR